MRRHLVTLTVLILILLPAACSRSGTGSDTFDPAERHEIAVPTTTSRIDSLATDDGQVVAEIPLGSDDQIRAGDFFRVYSTGEDTRLKGMLQVTEVVDGDRCLARMVGLQDRAAPFAVDDPVRLVRDLSDLGRGAEVERAARTEQEELDAVQAAERDRFEALRANYARELERLRQHQREEIARLRAEHQAAMTAEQERHARALARKEAERQSDLAALRSSLAAEARSTLREVRGEQDEEIARLRAERLKTHAQIDGLVAAQTELQQRIEKLVTELGATRRAHAKELAAEVETREVLQQRIVELESRLEGGQSTGTTVLTKDPDRDETILQRLERIARERDTASERNRQLVADMEHEKQARARLEQRLEETKQALTTLQEQDRDRAQLVADLNAARDELAALREHNAALELARLKTERAYFDLARRLLALPADHAGAVEDLQDHLRQALDPPRGRHEEAQ